MDGNSTRYDRSMFTLAAEYDVKDYLSFAGGARMLMASDREQRVNPEYRIHADMLGKTNLGEVDLSLRVRFTYGFEEVLYFTNYSLNVFVNRLRVKGSYHIFGTRFNVFASAESWGLISEHESRFFKKMRYSAGSRYALTLRSELMLRYIFEDEFNRVNPLQSHIFVFGYTYDL